MAYTAFLLHPDARESLLELFKPKWPERVIGHHLTWEFNRDMNALGDLPPEDSTIVIIGCISDDLAQSLLCTVNGRFTRPDGGYYHITWSLAPKAKPVHGGQIADPHKGVLGLGGLLIESEFLTLSIEE
jgi:hypothetical protein